jgi:hypothetical protein
MLSRPDPHRSRRYCLGRSHSKATNARTYRVAGHAYRTAGRHYGRICNAANCHNRSCSRLGSPLVLGLLHPSRPSAIIGFVIPVHVNPIDRMLPRRAVAHVGQKIWKRLPSVANLYPAPTVMAVIAPVLVIAPPSHFTPRSIGKIGLHRLTFGHGWHIADSPSVLKSWRAAA